MNTPLLHYLQWQFLSPRWKACRCWFGQQNGQTKHTVSPLMGATLTQIYASTVLYAVIGSCPYYQLDWSHSSTSSRKMTQRGEVEKQQITTHGQMHILQKKKKRKTAAVLFGNKQPVILHICTRIHECLVFSQGSTSTSLNVPLPPTHIDPVGPHKGPNDAQPLTTHHIYMQSANTITNVNTCEIRSKHAYPWLQWLHCCHLLSTLWEICWISPAPVHNTWESPWSPDCPDSTR